VTAGPAFGGGEDAVTVVGGLHAGLTALGWDAAVAGPGPGILGSAGSDDDLLRAVGAGDAIGGHSVTAGSADLAAYRDSGLPAETMGRSLDEDQLFFRAALAGGSVLGAAAIEAGAPLGEER
jgi:hypothetical protein